MHKLFIAILAAAFVAVPPVAAHGQATGVVINEVDSDQVGTDSGEFIELYDGGSGGTSLDGLVLVGWNGSDDSSYLAFDLDGVTTDANGLAVVGNPGVIGVDLTFSDATLQNGADAVALYVGDGTSWPAGTPLSTGGLVDALVYDTSDADDAGLLTLLNSGPAQVQVDEDAGSVGQYSIQRTPNGAGGQRDGRAFVAASPTPNAANAGSGDGDIDDDGILDAEDNCPNASNPLQGNHDADAQGDACDPDDDDDGKADGSDTCPAGDTGWTSNGATDQDSDGCRDAGEDTDDDNDTVADGSDSCRVLSADTPSGCPIAARELTLTYSKAKKRFKGSLTASAQSCVDSDSVTVWKQVKGDDTKVGQDEVNADGKYSVAKRGRPGKYYATASERVKSDVAVCGAATSPTLRLR